MKKQLGSFLLALFMGSFYTASGQNADHLEGCIYTSNFNSWNFYQGFKDKKTGKMVIPAIYDKLGTFSEGLVLANLDEKYGYLNTKGQIIIPFRYDQAGAFSEGLAVVMKDTSYGYINKTGVLVIPFKFERAGSFKQGLAPVMMKGKYGYINKTGQMVIPAKYDDAETFKHGAAIIKVGKNYGVIDKTGKEIIAPIYHDIDYFNEKLFIISGHGKSAIVDRTENYVQFMEYSSIQGFDDFWMSEEQYCKMVKNGLTGFLDRNGAIVAEPQFEDVRYSGRKGIVRVGREDGEGMLKYALYKLSEAKLLCDYQYDAITDFEEGFAAFARNNKVGFLDTNGVAIAPPVYDFAYSLNMGYAIIEDEMGRALIDTNFKIVSDHYDHIIPLKNGFYAVNNGGDLDEENNVSGGEFGVLDRTLKPIAEVKYYWMTDFNDYGVLFLISDGQLSLLDTTANLKLLPNVKDFNDFSNGMAPVRWDTAVNNDTEAEALKWGFMNTKGELVVRPVYDEGYPFSDGVAFLKKGEQWVLVDKAGKVLVNMDAWSNFQTEFSDRRAWVEKDEKRGYIDTTGKLVIPCIYSYATPFKEGQAEVGKDEADLIISTSGQTLRKFERSNEYDDYDE